MGQGDGIVVLCGDTAIVIDGGEESGWEAMRQVLTENRVERIACYVASHPHADHISNAAKLFASYEVESLMTTAFTDLNRPDSQFYLDMMEAAKQEENCRVIEAGGGDTFEFGQLKLEVFSPLSQTADYNDMSLVIRMTYKNVSFLFTGDASQNAERQITDSGAEIRSTVLKVGHHGGEDATGEMFLESVAPEYAVISCGYRNEYGHPHSEVLDRLKANGVKILRTDELGTVSLYSDGRQIFSKELDEQAEQ